MKEEREEEERIGPVVRHMCWTYSKVIIRKEPDLPYYFSFQPFVLAEKMGPFVLRVLFDR